VVCSQFAAEASEKSGVFDLGAHRLGIDLGGTKLALAVADARARVVARRRRATQPCGDPEADLARVASDARALLAEAGLGSGDLAAVGVSLPGPVDRARGAVVHPPNLPGWGDVPVRETLAAALRAPVRIENDANAGALAEWRFGAGRGCDDLVYLTMSTGVGGGLVLGGRLHAGRSGNAGEVGHAPVEWEGERCACGMRGCLEAYVGGAAWTRRLRRIAAEGGRVAALAGGRERVTPEHVVAAAREGDDFARGEMDRFNHYLARGIAILAFVVAPQRVVLGTIPTAAGEALCLAPVRERVRERVWPLLARELEIVPSGLGSELPYLAGIAVALEGEPAREGLRSATRSGPPRR
jgi:glucokinase